MWFTLKSWLNEPQGQMEPHTKLQLLNEHMCIWNICSWDGVLPRPILFPPSCLRSLRPWKLWTHSQQPLRQAESIGWTAEPKLRLVTGRTPSLKCFLKQMNRSCIHSKHVSLECNDCLSSAMVESFQMSTPPPHLGHDSSGLIGILHFHWKLFFNITKPFRSFVYLHANLILSLFSLHLHLQQNKTMTPLCPKSRPRSKPGAETGSKTWKLLLVRHKSLLIRF